MPRTWSSPMIPETPTTGARVATSASRIPGTARIVPTETTGFDGGTSTTSASLIASSTPGAGLASSIPIGTTAVRGTAAWWPDPVLLEVHRPALAGVGVVDDDVGLDPVVAHRQQLDPGLPARGTAPR